jgi:hypothetical protein
MLKGLEDFQSGRIYIDRLIMDLQGLWNALESSDAAWKQSFLSLWGHLEDARAAALFRGARNLNEEEANVVDKAIPRLKLMVLEKIDDPADHPRKVD